MSVFAQYVPTEFSQGSWETRREEAGQLALNAIAEYTTNMPDVVEHTEILGPPDIEEKVGLAGGHIFQGECLPDYMWDRRLAYKTPMDGVYLCGACTHPGGSVICANGHNAALTILNPV
jgi:phytoene dehydrogenase-like protein